ncbi:MAG: DNA-processing protein DprA [Pseudotabrizicola sp.]|uniref:DNA-processing protein DprA n=1 Tax=Pseudotabrizicola sp. TaxID=2939647 RepID=UPI00271D5FC8|nr:DNA-processing protein DprA [Pseudotabrizicola sp.]MDO8884694.1 DNA-processing protein DprA [Pseudotabrizicola sp.]MDP2080049.1 DNA-processing protein DprA [Pseudotabrizicola sp.]MDZ7575495.1 DNA-processing protein DprA [Pseudotabrizicola sp.]
MGQTSKPTPQPTPLDDDPVDCLCLIRSRRVGPVTWHRLMAEHGSARAALAALPDVARAAGVENYATCPVEVARHEMAQGRAAGAQMITWGEASYPLALCDLPDAPPVLWVIGDASLLHRPMLALVGARNASSLGLRMARRLAEGVAQAGLVTVSGLARGIDAAVHEATLATGTVAVQAGGVDVTYPEENRHLMTQIAAQGCLVSEQPMGLQPQARHFPQRNRIVSGLSRAVVVVEAAARSGSLITAKTALDQGRDVLVVPGHPFDARAAGCNILLRDGATLIRGPADVLESIGGAVVEFPAPPPDAEELPLPGPTPARRPLTDMAAVHSQILARLGPSPLAEDQLIRDLSMPPATVAQHLLTLELDGRVHRAPGGLLSRLD